MRVHFAYRVAARRQHGFVAAHGMRHQASERRRKIIGKGVTPASAKTRLMGVAAGS